MPTLGLITPTRNRAKSFALTERWIYLQTVQPDQWIVVNDGPEEYFYTRAQEVVIRAPEPNEGHSLPLNLLAGLKSVNTDYLAIIEDDDWFHPEYLAAFGPWMDKGFDLMGFKPSRHFNLSSHRFRMFRKSWCNLGSTVLKVETMKRALEAVCRGQASAGRWGVDVGLWAIHGARHAILNNLVVPKGTREQPEAYHVGLKGLPGEPGIGMGHKATSGYVDPPSLPTLYAWIGKDAADRYRSIMPDDHQPN